MISEAVLALEYGASSEDIARTTHAHVRFYSACYIRCVDVSYFPAHTQRGIQGGCHVGIRKADSLLDDVICYTCCFPLHALALMYSSFGHQDTACSFGYFSNSRLLAYRCQRPQTYSNPFRGLLIKSFLSGLYYQSAHPFVMRIGSEVPLTGRVTRTTFNTRSLSYHWEDILCFLTFVLYWTARHNVDIQATSERGGGRGRMQSWLLTKGETKYKMGKS